MTDKTPMEYFYEGQRTREMGLPHSACKLIFKSWPLECWQMGWRLADIEELVKSGDMREVPLERVLSSPYDQGKVSYLKGIGFDDCAYEPTTENALNWQVGWQESWKLSELGKARELGEEATQVAKELIAKNNGQILLLKEIDQNRKQFVLKLASLVVGFLIGIICLVLWL